MWIISLKTHTHTHTHTHKIDTNVEILSGEFGHNPKATVRHFARGLGRQLGLNLPHLTIP